MNNPQIIKLKCYLSISLPKTTRMLSLYDVTILGTRFSTITIKTSLHENDINSMLNYLNSNGCDVTLKSRRRLLFGRW